MRQASKCVPDSAEKTVRDIRRAKHAGIIPLKRRSALCWKACAAESSYITSSARRSKMRRASARDQIRSAKAGALQSTNHRHN
jgi:hypothetical protein